MKNISSYIKEKYLHIAFQIGIILKGMNAFVEIVGGAILLSFSKEFLTSWILTLSQQELIENPKDKIASYIIYSVHQFSVSTQHFVAIYLLIHGIVKILLVVNLLKNRLWAYPTSIFVFFIFIVYQLYRFSISHSYGLILLSIFDLIIIMLTIHEYNRKKFILKQ